MNIMTRRHFINKLALNTSLGLIGVTLLNCQTNQEKKQPNNIVKPAQKQVDWQNKELGMFYHFDIRVYKPDWKWPQYEDLPDPSIYNPTQLDTDEWLQAAKAMGAKYAVLVAKHGSGFLQWQTDLYPYGLKQARWKNGRGDLVKDFVESCHKYGIKPGIYASVTHNSFLKVGSPGLVNRGEGGDAEEQKKYAQICEQMLTELWSNYGELVHVWFDGGALPPEEGGPDMIPLLEKYQPHANVFQGPAATVRWVGNERGVANYPCWATIKKSSLEDREKLPTGDPDGELWLPGECDVPVRNHDWFWQPDAEHKLYSLKELVDMYYKSVGRNCNFLLNANPDQEGKIPSADFERYVEFGREIRNRFDHPVAQGRGQGKQIEIDCPLNKSIDHVVMMEDITQGERVRQYEIQGMNNKGEWSTICPGESIGHKRIERFEPVRLKKIRIRATKSIAKPLLSSIKLYSVTS
jgi:alpha-L-fucosidase